MPHGDERERSLTDQERDVLVLDQGPIRYQELELAGDPDLEHGLEHLGLDPQLTSYRLIDMPLAQLAEAAWWPKARPVGQSYLDLARSDVALPPIVVLRTRRGWGLIDGMNRSHAYWAIGRTRVAAHELLGPPLPTTTGLRPD